MQIPEIFWSGKRILNTAVTNALSCFSSRADGRHVPLTTTPVPFRKKRARHERYHMAPNGTSDYNCVDVIREAGATIVAAAQSTTSLIPPLGNDKSKVLTLNLRNRMIFRSADEADAVQAADFLGKKQVVKRSWGSSAGKRNVNYSETEEHKIKTYKLRKLRDHECVLVHCEKGFRRMTLPPLEADGKISRWFSWWKRLI
jgi:hypothetical protein